MTTPTTTGFEDIDATIAGLQALAAWREAHPEISGHLYAGTSFLVTDSNNKGLSPAEIVRHIAHGALIGDITKKPGTSNPEIMFIDRQFGGEVEISYQASRDQVCTRRVTGVETVEVPDPDAPLVKVEREIVEWDCEPILAGAR